MINLLIPLAKFFDSNLGSFAKKVLAGLGIGVISYTAVTAGFNTAVSFAQSHYNNLAVDIISLANLGGIGEAMGLIVGAITFRLTVTTMSKLGVIPK